jgi:diguanylate cyclase (GGDEF)-like protein
VTVSPADFRWLTWLRGGVRRYGRMPVAVLLAAAGVALTLPLVGAAALTGGPGAAIAVAVAALLAAVPASWAFVLVADRFDEASRRLALASTRDELTGLLNRRHFVAVAEAERARCRRYDLDAALLVVDADHFGSLVDTHGRECGERYLRELARVVGQALRQPDVLARYDGDAFAVFLPHTDPLGALDVAERIRVQAGDLRVECEGLAVGTTVSIGVAPVGPGHGTLDALLLDADAALLAAKQAGRNCVRSVGAARGRAAGAASIGTRKRAGPV